MGNSFTKTLYILRFTKYFFTFWRLVEPNDEIGYNKFLTPPAVKNEKSLYVDVSYDIHNVIQINEDKNYIKLMYSLHKTWYNSFLTYRNLKKDKENYVFQDDKDMIWTPSIETINMEARDKCKQTEKSEIFKVIPNKETV